MRLQTTKQLKNNTNIETLQPTKKMITAKYQRMGTQPMKTKTNKYTRRLRYKKARIHCEIFLSDYFMKHSLMHSSLHLV